VECNSDKDGVKVMALAEDQEKLPLTGAPAPSSENADSTEASSIPSLKTMLTPVPIPIPVAPLAGRQEVIVGGVLSGLTVVVNCELKVEANTFPARSFADVANLI
jgi:hypothetical protein